LFVAKEDPGVDEGSVEVSSGGGVAEASEAVDSQDGEPKPEEKTPPDEQPDGSSSEEIWIGTLETTDGPVVDEEVIEVPCEPMIYFRSLSSGIVDEEALDENVLDGEVIDDSIFYTLSFGDAGDVDGELLLEMAANSDVVQSDDTVKSDDVSDDGEIRTLGGSTSDDLELFFATAAPYISPWYNPDNPLDANLDGATSALDALIVFNSLSNFGPVQLSRALFALSSFDEVVSLDENFRVDASNDGFLSPLDALMRVNYLSQPTVEDDSADASADQGRIGDFASILPGEWDQYEPADDGELNDSLPSEDSGDDLSTDVFSSRLRDPNIDWPDDELVGEPNDGEADDEFWSKLADSDSGSILDEETLELLARS
jgi:hypothetical protein